MWKSPKRARWVNGRSRGERSRRQSQEEFSTLSFFNLDHIPPLHTTLLDFLSHQQHFLAVTYHPFKFVQGPSLSELDTVSVP